MITFCSLCHKSRLFAFRVESHVWSRNFNKLTVLYNKLSWSDSVDSHIKHLITKHNRLTEELLNSQNLSPKEIKNQSSEVHRLKPIIKSYTDMKNKENYILEIKNLSDTDAELQDLVDEEIDIYQTEISELKSKLIDAVIPRDEDDIHNAIVEIRAGVGGKEAGLFASEVFSMYTKLSTLQRWKFEVLSQTENLEGGLNKAVASIVGKNVFGTLKYEIGVHRVQRVPLTESQGRIHTSTISVCVLPQPTNIDVVLNMKDVKVDTYKSSGPGGQSVNTTDSAVRMTHLPTGIVVASQEDKSQINNRKKCIQVLSAKLKERERTRRLKEQDDARRAQIGNADRSERIRTYNFPQDRITDHRIGETIHSIGQYLSAGPSFLELSDKLGERDKMDALLSL